MRSFEDWKVLYPNAEGRITLLGEWDRDTGVFVLRAWQLPERLSRIVLADENDPTSERTVRTNQRLRRSDFSGIDTSRIDLDDYTSSR